jgi:two-component system cell cycle response regulator
MRIVVVDTSRTVLKIVGRMLEARGHEVMPFTDGRAALAHIEMDVDVAAVITSAELITMTGIEMCWETRLLAGNHRPIYIVLMSSNYDRRHLAEALDMGADDFIGKPPAPEELYARLRAAERLIYMQQELIRLATTDPLTGVRNRRAFFERAEQACLRATNGAPLSAIMFDIDHFKKINDAHGHAVGNVIFGRLGGEEFAILLENAELPGAIALAEHIRRKLAALRFEFAPGLMTVTCSFGVSEWQRGDTIDTLLKRADTALYEAKNSGRNRVVCANVIVADLRTRLAGDVMRSMRG